MALHEFWRDRESGELWAVELEGEGVLGAYGPLHWSEISPLYARLYPYSATTGREVAERRDALEPIVRSAVLALAGDPD